MTRLFLPLLLGTVLVITWPTVVATQPPILDAQAACRELLGTTRMTEEGHRGLRQLLESGKAPDVMDRLIHIALASGEADVLRGFARIFERLERTSDAGPLARLERDATRDRSRAEVGRRPGRRGA